MTGVGNLRTLGEVSRHHAAEAPWKTALSFEGRDTSYDDFDRNGNRVANALIAAGVVPGDRVIYWGKNSDRYFELFFGAAKMGAVMTPINGARASRNLLYRQ